MACESWRATLDTYLDGELSQEEMRAFDAHVRGCQSCAAEALARVQMKRALHAAGKRFVPTPEFRARVRQSVAAKPQPSRRLSWISAPLAVAVVVVGALTTAYVGTTHSRTTQVYSEIADLHVAMLASSSPVDVVSSDRHTVKPWFQGRIPFSFDLPELQNSDFVLLGARMTYLDQTPGAHLIYQLRKHRISVLVFREEAFRDRLAKASSPERKASFNVETWGQNGLRYFVIGDVNAADIDSLAKLVKATSS
jgi:anti-sigma factor RsiW